MSLYSQGIIRVITEPKLKQVNDYAVVEFLGGIPEGKDKNGEYINNSIDCEVWGKQANVIMEYVGEGGCFQASGIVLSNEWNDKATGNKRRKHLFKIQRVELLPRAKDEAPAQRQPLQQQQPVLSGGNDESLPF